MEYILQENDNKHLIILVHGLNGSAETWRGSNQNFVEILCAHTLIKENFDVALYVYHTKIFIFNNNLAKVKTTLKSLFKNRSQEDIDKFIVGIETVSRPLEADIRGVIDKYDTISFIAHSMGGLVVKSAMTWMNENIYKVKLFVSLSVPHIGASLANIGTKLIGDNPQLKDLKVMGPFTTTLNERYANLKHLPDLIYQHGIYDTVVKKAAAIPANVPTIQTEITHDNHSSILLIKDSRNNTVFNRIIKELDLLLQPNAGVQVNIIQDTPFGFLIAEMASSFEVSVNIDCFTSEELSTKLRADKISSLTIEDFFIKIGKLAITTLPDYTVTTDRKKLKYTFFKNQ